MKEVRVIKSLVELRYESRPFYKRDSSVLHQNNARFMGLSCVYPVRRENFGAFLMAYLLRCIP